MQVKETPMIELTEQQMAAITAAGRAPAVVVDLQTKTPYVLLRQDVYELLKDQEYDDSPWTDEERELLAWEAGKHAGWDEMDEYDHYPEKK
jgi:hypothetical protein